MKTSYNKQSNKYTKNNESDINDLEQELLEKELLEKELMEIEKEHSTKINIKKTDVKKTDVKKTDIKKNNLINQLINNKGDIYNNIEEIMEQKITPLNYGNRWSEEDKNKLIEQMKIYASNDINFEEIAKKLGRTEGGVKGELKKMIIKNYMSGIEVDMIAKNFNLTYKYVKMIIISYLDKEIDVDISNLQKENLYFKLKIENINLRKDMNKIMTMKQ